MHTDTQLRSYEVVARRLDGSVFIGQDRAPAIPLFENAFSAFAHGTMIQTDKGDIAVEDLQPGDLIVKSNGQTAPLVWVGSSSFVPADTGKRTPLVRTMADSLGQGRPLGFLTFGPAARILHTPSRLRGGETSQQMLTLMRDLVDGVNIIEIMPPTPVRLYHLCLEKHAAISVSGLEVETFHPGLNTLRHLPIHLRDKFLGLFPHIEREEDFGPLAFPRAPDSLDHLL